MVKADESKPEFEPIDPNTRKAKLLGLIFDENPIVKWTQSKNYEHQGKREPYVKRKGYSYLGPLSFIFGEHGGNQFWRGHNPYMEGMDEWKPNANSEVGWGQPMMADHGIWKMGLLYQFSRHGTTANVPDLFGINDMMILPMSTAHSCQDLEVSAWECMEYYGEKRGAVICRDYYDDFIECTHQNIQRLRALAVRAKRRERWLEYMSGKRDYSTVFQPIEDMPTGVYMDPCPNPRDAFMRDANSGY